MFVQTAPWGGRRWIVTALALAAILAGLAWHGLPRTGAESGATAHRHEPSPAVRYPEMSGFAAVDRQEVTPAVPAPDFRLIDQSGDPLSLGDLTGKVVVLSFTYTNCPEACPLLTGYYLSLQETFAEALAQERLALVFITTDPERDTPEHLHAYTVGRGAQWRFLTGEKTVLQPVWEEYQVRREERAGLQDIVIYHSYRTYVLDQEGRIRTRYTGVWQPQDVAADVGTLLAQHE